jgi:hypothetical protein
MIVILNVVKNLVKLTGSQLKSGDLHGVYDSSYRSDDSHLILCHSPLPASSQQFKALLQFQLQLFNLDKQLTPMALAISTKRSGKLIYVLGTGLLTGTLDAIAAILLNWKVPAAKIFMFIASGWFGKAEAYTGGTKMVLFGVLFHYLIAFSFTTLLFLLHPMFYSWFRTRILTAIFYGIVIWAIMNLIVVPLSNIPYRPFQVTGSLVDCIILMIAFGIPISFIATGFYFYKRK